MNLSIKKITENEFEVKVQAKSITFHQVTISEEFYLYLTNKKISKKTLLVFSFNFLLERENNSSILSSFDLPIISNYFSDYENQVRRFIESQ
tara:strand:+ start:1248 stop:1523 length:276 start_codon:yes stop_codon:yes gene_type:complete